MVKVVIIRIMEYLKYLSDNFILLKLLKCLWNENIFNL